MLLAKTIGDQIALLRKKQGYTQIDLGEIVGVSKQTVSNWENEVKTPRMGAIQKLADHFNVPKSYIVDGSNEIDLGSITIRKVPFVKTISTDESIVSNDNIFEYIPVVGKYLQEDKDYIFFEFFGEFMNLEFKEGTKLLCEKNYDIKSGDIALLDTKEGDVFISKVSINDDSITLIPFSTNQNLQPIAFADKDCVNILGKIVSSFRRH